MPSVLLTKDQLLKAKRKIVEVDIPELGGKVRLASFSANAAMRYAELMEKLKKGESVTADMMRLTLSTALVDEHDKPLFTLETVEELLSSLSPDIVTSLAKEIGNLNSASTRAAELGNSVASSSGA